MILWLAAWLAVGAHAAAVDPLSVYNVNPRLDLGLAAGATAGSAATYFFGDGLINERCPCDPHSVNALDRQAVNNHATWAADLSDVLVAAAVAAPVVADWKLLGTDKAALREDLIVYTQTLAAELFVVTAVKYSAQRPLPRTYAGDSDLLASARGYRSMYSGHTAVTAGALSAAAMTATLRYGAGWWPWLVAAGSGVAAGAGRIAAGDHFYTDVAAGLGAGMAIGAGVPWLHRRKAPVPGLDVDVLPAPGGATLRVRF